MATIQTGRKLSAGHAHDSNPKRAARTCEDMQSLKKSARLDTCLVGAPRITITLVGLSETRNPSIYVLVVFPDVKYSQILRMQRLRQRVNRGTEGDCSIDYQCLSELSHLRIKSILRLSAKYSKRRCAILVEIYVVQDACRGM